MKQLILNLEKRHRKEFKKISQEMDAIYPALQVVHKTDTTSVPDCKFLQLLCLDVKPKKIIEIGTWIGSTAYALSAATKETKAMIYTCDINDEFVNRGCELSERIKIYPQTWSSTFLNDTDTLLGTDFIFNDADIRVPDCEKIYDLAAEEFVFTTHDYFNATGGFEKGYRAIQAMLHVLKTKGASFTFYLPEEDWYFSGYNGINGCVALIRCKKAV